MQSAADGTVDIQVSHDFMGAEGEFFFQIGNYVIAQTRFLRDRYRFCIEESRDVVYLSIGKKRCFVNLALIYPQEGYRSRAIRAFEDSICRVMATEVF